MSLPAERGRFAVKGRASAAGAMLPADLDDAAAETTAAPPVAAETDGGAERKAAADQQPGSLLAFRLRSAPGKSALTGEIVTALSRPAATKPAVETVAAAVEQAAPPSPEAAPAPAVPAPAAPTPAASVSPAPPAPFPSVGETPGGRIDQPAFPQPLPQRRDLSGEHSAAKAQVPTGPVIAIPPRPSTLRTVLPAAAAVAAIAVVGWLIAQSDPSAPEAPAPVAEHTPAPAPAAAADTDTAQATAAGAAPAEAQAALEPPASPPAAETEAEDDTAAAPVPAVTEAAAPAAPALDAAEMDEAASDPLAGPAAMDMPVPAPLPAAIPIDAPSFEVVRAEPGAAPVLAGRAAPGSQLLVLDNGTLIGTATADLNGEWALVGEAPLSPGRHELSLALKTPDGSLVVEQADAEMAPSSASATGLPIPAAKPTPGTAARSYVVQLASVPSSADATREWARLQQAYPALLGQREATIDAAEIGGRGTFYRIRTGPFTERESARSLCRELNGAGQECLVVRSAGGS